MRLAVRVTPRGGRDAVDGWTRDDADRPVLKLRVAAAAADGAANDAIIALLARSLSVPKSSVQIMRGHTARLKQVEVTGLDTVKLATAFGEP